MMKQCDDCKKLFNASYEMKGFGMGGEILLCESCYRMRKRNNIKFLYFLIAFVGICLLVYKLALTYFSQTR